VLQPGGVSGEQQMMGDVELCRAVDVGLRLLSIRARSRHELLAALSRKGLSETAVEHALAKLAGWGYLDDGAFARGRALGLLRRGRFGERRVRASLQAHGIDPALAQEALAHAKEEAGFDPLATARAVLERRGLLGRPLAVKERARAARLLLSRGFERGDIGRVLEQCPLATDPEEG
jgi:regulatory protein